MKCSLGICNFLPEISSCSYSVVFLYIFALITEERFLISPLELCIQMGISFLFSFAFKLLFFSQLFVRPPQKTILPFFFLGMVFITTSYTMLWISVHSSSGTLSDPIPWIYLLKLSFLLVACILDFIRLIIFFVAKDGEALYSHQIKTKSWLWLRSWTPYCKI